MIAPEAQPRVAASPWRPASPRAAAMALLAVLFALRVVGQVLVTYAGVDWLPGVEHWQSGLLPYPALLASQVAILALLAVLTAAVWRGRGRLAAPGARVGRAIAWFAAAYAASMVVRYVASMVLRPEWRWFGHSIPIAFHLFLAAWLGLYARARGGTPR